MYDVIVIGAGPTGSTAANICAKSGLSTLILEEHSSIGFPVQCAGLLSNSAFEECNVSNSSIINRVTGAKIIGSDDNHVLDFNAPEPKAVVVNRNQLDYEMATHAIESGANISLKTVVTSISPDKNKIYTVGVNGKQEYTYKTLIAADGPRSVTAHVLGLGNSKYVYSGIQAEIPWNGNPNQVEIYPNASSDFFAWVIPISSNRARVGLCGMKNVLENFNRFIKRFSSPSRINEIVGTLPIGIRPKTYAPRCLIVGDAAGFLKPISGGGIYTGVRSAKHAATVAIMANTSDDYS
ncbi:MAG TPA: NAD(P)/FAD-dependent oxidoreductase, partial [Methanocorpusculum sp.]|nr:NAD(P)/FAD-dependent oxidoreductase [Methanocorpusculum sp.]